MGKGILTRELSRRDIRREEREGGKVGCQMLAMVRRSLEQTN